MAALHLPRPYDFALSTERIRVFGPDLATLWHEGGVHRVVAGREVRIEPGPGGVDVEPLDAETEPAVGRLLGLPFDLGAFAAFAAGDGVLRGVVSRLAGLRPLLVPEPFEALVGSITAQQVSLHSAVAIRNRLIERFGTRVGHPYAFPTAARLAGAREDELVALGFSRRKAEYVLGLARSALDLAALSGLPDDEVKAQLTSLRGLGEWTADWFLARHLARPRAWPAGDLALRKAVLAFYPDVRDVRDVRAAGARFAPFENLTAHYLLTASRVPA